MPVPDKKLPEGVARLHVELADFLGRLREDLEELVVDLHAFGLLPAAEVVVGDLKARSPVLRRLAVGERGDLLLGLLELPEREHPANLNGEEPHLGLRPLLLRRLDDRPREIGETVVHQGLNVRNLGLEFGILLRCLRRHCGRSGLFREDRRRQHGRQCQNGSNLKPHDEGDYTTFSA